MSYELILNQRHVIATLGQDNKLNYNRDGIEVAIKEMIEGSPNGTFVANFKVAYRWDADRWLNNEHIWKLWKKNPIAQNRILQLNALVFGRGLQWAYDDQSAQRTIDRFWRVNRLRGKLNSLNTDAQLYGEVFIALYPQSSGDTLLSIYESNQVDIQYSAGDVSDVLKYMVKYYDEDQRKDIELEFEPMEKYLNKIEFEHPINNNIVTSVRRALGLMGKARVKGRGVMCHVKFNNSSSEVHGTSDFKQVYDILPDYMNFVGDRLSIHQMYGSPAYDITIDTDDPEKINQRIEELASFTLGSNPVHNKSEEWKPLEFQHGALQPDKDEKMMRGLICAGLGFPEYLLFNQSELQDTNKDAFALTKITEDRQDAFSAMFKDIHKVVMCFAGYSPDLTEDGNIVFPTINTMTEKEKAETYLLEVNSNVCSRKTASMALGHNWDMEIKQMQEEAKILAPMMELMTPDNAGRTGGYTAGAGNRSNPNKDDGADDKNARQNAQNITSQSQGNRKTND